MREYHKIQSVFKRDQKGRFLLGEFARPELEYLLDCEWEWTEKVDGTNIRIGLAFDPPDDSGNLPALSYAVGGRTDRAQIPATLLDAIEALGLREKLPALFDGPVTLYGEGYGAKIQKGGGNYRPDQGFILFDVKVGEWWLDRENVEDVADKLGLEVVPLWVTSKFKTWGNRVVGTLRAAIADVAGGHLQSVWTDVAPEGLVGKPVVPLFNRKGERIVVKVKVKDFERLRRDGIDLGEWAQTASSTSSGGSS
ncbi:MAG: hypothetical protein GY913_21510 [Proteobacteria bacterium]|nr:hypothetical protein [Pseudomonadota bacterium]